MSTLPKPQTPPATAREVVAADAGLSALVAGMRATFGHDQVKLLWLRLNDGSYERGRQP
jgi:hypothetical protein